MKRKKIDPLENAVNLLNDLVPSLSCKRSKVNNQFVFHFNDDDSKSSTPEHVRFALLITSLLKNVGFTDELIKNFIAAAQSTGYVIQRKNSNVIIRDYVIDGSHSVIEALSAIALTNKPQKSKWDLVENAGAGLFQEKLPQEIGAYIGLFLLNERKILACVNKAAYVCSKIIENTLHVDGRKY